MSRAESGRRVCGEDGPAPPRSPPRRGQSQQVYGAQCENRWEAESQRPSLLVFRYLLCLLPCPPLPRCTLSRTTANTERGLSSRELTLRRAASQTSGQGACESPRDHVSVQILLQSVWRGLGGCISHSSLADAGGPRFEHQCVENTSPQQQCSKATAGGQPEPRLASGQPAPVAGRIRFR